MWECHLERRSEEHRDTAAVGGVPGEDTPRLHEVRLPHVVVHPHHRRQFGQLEGTHPAVTRRLDHMIRTGMRVHEVHSMPPHGSLCLLTRFGGILPGWVTCRVAMLMWLAMCTSECWRLMASTLMHYTFKAL